jgi:hypothetical protein
MSHTINEQLFTELTAQEASVIEGGARLILYNATAIRSDADFGPSNGDDVFIKVNGNKVYGTNNDVDTGETAYINKSIYFSGTAKVNFFDADPWPNDDDYLGGFTVGSTPTGGKKTVRISGSGSVYDVTYQVV